MKSIKLIVNSLLARTLFSRGNEFANIAKIKFLRKFPNLQYSSLLLSKHHLPETAFFKIPLF